MDSDCANANWHFEFLSRFLSLQYDTTQLGYYHLDDSGINYERQPSSSKFFIADTNNNYGYYQVFLFNIIFNIIQVNSGQGKKYRIYIWALFTIVQNQKAKYSQSHLSPYF